ncbi:DNA topoisomerase [Marivirga lumbricoides]|uniref:DNA topoisomerase n=1 Tax=Marivirga lumbricoides TaxID=1046115 RepID=A0ABQ1ME51_9BACT|nr:DNA topoisomerase [Marivirga lumbricoides]
MKNKKQRLRHIDDSALEIERRKSGRGYAYFDGKGEKIISPVLLSRLKKIVVPPMWSEVKICKFDDGHIQATGRDAKGRKQYIYHSEWERIQQEKKFSRMIEFGKTLPAIRKQSEKDLAKPGWDKQKITALMVSILDEYGVRIGNRYYQKENETYGLTTLRRRHLQKEGDELILKYKGKSGIMRSVTIEDNELAKHIQKAADLPGYEIFRYKDEHGKMQSVDSHEVNEYICKTIGEDFSSKDFRTWAGSRLALELYPEAIELKKQSKRKKFGNILIRLIADELGNTPSICKTYYIHPQILDKVNEQAIPLKNPYRNSSKSYGLTSEEKLLLALLET